MQKKLWILKSIKNGVFIINKHLYKYLTLIYKCSLGNREEEMNKLED